jgi:putative hydrolase of HD superfamily
MRLDEVLEKLGNLKEIPRTGWLFAGVSLDEVEDVAQHSFEVTTIALFLSDELRSARVKLNRERVLMMAIVHDWPEALVADFPYTALKYLGPPSVKEEMESAALSELLGGAEEYSELWREYREGKAVEAKLVHAADYLSMLFQALKYRDRGNRSRGLEELWKAVLRDLEPYIAEFPPVKNLVEELKTRFSR